MYDYWLGGKDNVKPRQPPAAAPLARRAGQVKPACAYRGWVRSALPQPPAFNRRSLPEPVKETRLDRTRTTRGRPTGAGRRSPASPPRQGRAKRAEAPARQPPAAAPPPAPATEPRNASPPQARTGETTRTTRGHGMASNTPATATPHPGRKRQHTPKPGTARQNPRPGSQHQSSESGQSQEPPSSEPDIRARSQAGELLADMVAPIAYAVRGGQVTRRFRPLSASGARKPGTLTQPDRLSTRVHNPACNGRYPRRRPAHRARCAGRLRARCPPPGGRRQYRSPA